MPLLSFDLIEGRTDAEIVTLLDAAHEAVLEAFSVPERDRYQIVNEPRPGRLVVQDTGLGIPRTDRVVLVRVLSRPRTRQEKTRFYEVLAQRLEAACGIAPSDLVVSFVVNQDEDWSFGHGSAQFLTGAL
jgi:hypothetical protein